MYVYVYIYMYTGIPQSEYLILRGRGGYYWGKSIGDIDSRCNQLLSPMNLLSLHSLGFRACNFCSLLAMSHIAQIVWLVPCSRLGLRSDVHTFRSILFYPKPKPNHLKPKPELSSKLLARTPQLPLNRIYVGPTGYFGSIEGSEVSPLISHGKGFRD